nr:MAG TPA: hypothetical protein [Bacteriophage sp.]
MEFTSLLHYFRCNASSPISNLHLLTVTYKNLPLLYYDK